MKRIVKYWPLIFILGVCFLYYWKVFLKGYVPFPGDLLVGAYLPWLEDKWGYPTGVPVRNPLISDAFSQFYLWKSLISEAFRNFSVPLWNPFSYSGYPLMATFHSGAFYPLNIIHALLGDVRGWSFLVIFPSIASAVAMYLYLREIKQDKVSSLGGSIVYAYSGFAISWAQFITAAQAMIWMPLVLLLLEKYFSSKRRFYAYWIPVIFFLIITSGHFQILVYMTALTVVYFAWKWFEGRDFTLIRNIIIPGLLTVGLSAVQLLPTLEMSQFGLRTSENAISARNFGLLPLRNLVTLIAPDYFGNPSTYNFFGFFNYHETIFYGGILIIFALIGSLFLLKNNKYVRFFFLLAILTLLLGFDTPLGRAIYVYKVPGISTSDAGRIAVLFALSTGVLTAYFMSSVVKMGWKKILMIILGVSLLYALIGIITLRTDAIFDTLSTLPLTISQRRLVSVRNLILPGMLIGVISLLLMLSKKWKVFLLALVTVAALDMVRFGWKYIPFVPERIVYPDTPVTEFIKNDGQGEVYRIDRERAEIMPPATWMAYRFMSPSGYDPMARADYVSVYQEKINDNRSGFISRYSELERYDAAALGEFNVKYLMAVKRDKTGRIPGDNVSERINQKEWKMVFETKATAVFENTLYQPRARFVEDGGLVKIISYQPNQVSIEVSKAKDKTLLLADSWYPGWKAFMNAKEYQIDKCNGIFRCVKLDLDSGVLEFKYQPDSFRNGAIVSIVSFAGIVAALMILRKRKD